MESYNCSPSESSENNLRHNVVSTLHQTGYYQHQTLDITVDNGTVIVEGRVPTWYLRQIAMECIRCVPGVSRVVDRIRVVRESPDETRLSVSAAVFRHVTELGALESEAGRTICLPVSEGRESHVPLMQDSFEISAEHVQNSPDPWFGPQIEVPDQERQLQTVCG